MSAICGILMLTQEDLQVRRLEKMMHSLHKHGPDGNKIWRSNTIALGHQMMHITPESLQEELPFQDSESQIAITMNGRIDNREDLFSALDMPQHSSVPDSLIVLNAYLKWGVKCLDHLIGEFAILLWNAKQQQLLCITDTTGVKPLFYSKVDNRYFIVASEIKALLAALDSIPSMNERKLAMLGVCTNTLNLDVGTTFFKNLFWIPAASVLTIDSSKMSIREYWIPDVKQRLDFRSDDECREAYQETFCKAVKSRLRSAFPVASMLSGGLDSSGIVAIASKLLKKENKRLITLSNMPEDGFQHLVTHEREFIELIKNVENLDMHYISAPGRGPFDNVDDLVKSASLGSYNFQHFLYTEYIKTAVNLNTRIILDGCWGETSVTGYMEGYLSELLIKLKWKTLSRELKLLDSSQNIPWRVIKHNVLRPLIPSTIVKRINRLNMIELTPYPLHAEFVNDILGNQISCIKDRLVKLTRIYPNHRKNIFNSIMSGRSESQQNMHAGYLLFEKAEFSYPYLDKRMLEFGLAVAPQFKYKNGEYRRLFRIGMANDLPPRILTRTSKEPFSPDYPLRFQRDKEKASSYLVGSTTDFGRKLIDINLLMRIIDRNAVGPSRTPRNAYREAMFTVPFGVYLSAYIKQFGH